MHDGTSFAVFRHGRQWYVRFSAGGRQLKKSVCPIEGSDEGQAREAARAVVQETLGQLERARRSREPQHPIGQYQKRIAGRSDSHKANCARFQGRLIEYFGPRQELLALTREDVERWRDWLLTEAPRKDKGKGERGLAPKTVKEHLDWLAAVFTNAERPNPCNRVERPRRKEEERQDALEFFTPDEMRRMFAISAECVPWFHNAFTFLAYTGCRVAEMQGVRPEDMDAATRIVWVRGKGGTRRPLMLTGAVAPAWEAIKAQAKALPRADGFIFPQYETFARKGMDRLCLLAFGAVDAAGEAIEDVQKLHTGRPNRPGHPHMLRHTLASLALMHWSPAWDIAFLAKWLGHRDIKITYQIYGHWIAQAPPSGYTEASRTSLEQAGSVGA